MSFEDIDTPVSESELSGDVAELDNETVEEAAEKPAPVVEQEAQAEEAEPTQERAPVIPRARFDEVNAKLHAEREEVERLRAELAAAQQQKEAQAESPPSDIKAMIREAKEAMMDGDLDKAAELEYKIQQETQRAAMAEAEQNVMRRMSERESQSALSSTVSQIVAAYPFLDSASPDANADAIGDVIEWRDFYMAKGDPAHVAIQRATNKVAPMYAAVEPAPVKQDTRKAAALARNAIDSAAQAPANVAGVGNRAAPSQPKVESQKDWEKLSDAEREALLQ